MGRRFNYNRLAMRDRMWQNGWEQVEPAAKKKKAQSKNTKSTKRSPKAPPLVFEWDPPR